MSLIDWAMRHRRFVLTLFGAVVLGGVLASLKTPVTLFPSVSFPRVEVSVNAMDRPASQMEIAVTRILEQSVRAVPGVTSLRSVTSRGSAQLSVNFEWGHDMASAMLQVESAVNQALPALPPGTSFSVRRMDPTVFPVAAYSLTSPRRSPVELKDLAMYRIAPLLSSIEGVSRVAVMGGEQAEYQIDIDPARLDALGLNFSDVAARLSSSNILQAVGRMEDQYRLFLMMSDTRLRDLDDIRGTILRSAEDGLVRLGDVATLSDGYAPQWLRVTADGRDAVLVQVYQQPGGNTVHIVDEVGRRLRANAQILPGDVSVANWYDQSQLIVQSANSVRDAIAIGAVLAAIVLFVFLRSLRITLIAMFVVPATLACTALIMHALGMSFNVMTLGGMAAAVGLIVDDAIVMLEHIVRRLRQSGGDVRRCVREAAKEFTPPLMGSSAATLVIFLPLAYLGGVTGAFFKALSLTMASALTISFLLSWLAVPLLAERMIAIRDAQCEDGGRWSAALKNGYRSLMRVLLIRPYLVLGGVVPAVVLGGIAYLHVGSGFMPEMDEGGFILDYRAGAGTSLSETDRLLRQVEAIVAGHPAVATYSRRTGAQLGGGLTEANEGDMFVRLKPFPRAPIDAVMDEIRGRIQNEVPGLEIEMALLMEDLIGDLTAVPQPIEIMLHAQSTEALLQSAPRVAHAIEGVRGVVDIKDGITLAGEAINISVDRDKAALLGVDPEFVTQQLRAWFGGIVTTTVQQSQKSVPIRVWVSQRLRHNIDQIGHLWLHTPTGQRFQLRRVAEISQERGQAQIVRDELRRTVAVTARISGTDMGSTIEQIKKVLGQTGVLAPGMYYELGGLYKQQQSAFQGLIVVFLAAFALVFLLLIYLYEEFAAALAILISPVLALSAVFLGLWASDIELSITAMMGMTMIVGIVTEVSIFYFSEYHDLLKQGVKRDRALIEAGENRMRPIIMTSLAAILALSPLALGLGQGSAMQQPLAVAIISGLGVQIPLVLVVMPVVYRVMTGRQGACVNSVNRP